MESVEIERAVAGPFITRNVHEWSSLDQLGGLFEHSRVHTDHWTTSTSNSSHHFGKVVDSRSRELAGGGKEQQHQTKQLEMFQAQVPGGSVQVIRSSTTSSWQTQHKVTLNPLDISLQKTKACIGRSGSIKGRRPPSRNRSIVGSRTEEHFDNLEESSAASELMSKNIGKTLSIGEVKDLASENTKRMAQPLTVDKNIDVQKDQLNVNKNEYKYKSIFSEPKLDSIPTKNNFKIIRQKSCSSENLNFLDEVEKTDSNSVTWNRSATVRRSLQFPQKSSALTKDNIDCPTKKSVSELRRQIEERKQLISYKVPVPSGAENENVITDSKDHSRLSHIDSLKKKQTVITAESLKDVRGRLRKISSHESKIVDDDDVDDGSNLQFNPILEQQSGSPKKVYLFGMEVLLRSLPEKSIVDNNKTITNGDCRTEENDCSSGRISHDFDEKLNRIGNNHTALEDKKPESSTESGMFISSATFSTFPKIHTIKSVNAESSTTHSINIKPINNLNPNKIERDAVVQSGGKTIINVTRNGNVPNYCNDNVENRGSFMEKEERPEGTTDKWNISGNVYSLKEDSKTENRFSKPITISIPVQKHTKFDLTDPKRLLLKQTDGIKGFDDCEEQSNINQNGINSYSQLIFGRDNGESESSKNGPVSENIPWRTGRTKKLSNFFDTEFKRHSIAVDKAKYLKPTRSFVQNYDFDGSEFGTDHNLFGANEKVSNTESDNDLNSNDKKHKKVEFSKTEVHFAAEPGRFNIVETDGKPPPSVNYGRRRKSKTEATKLPGQTDQPVIRFGDIPDEFNLFKANDSILLNDNLITSTQLVSETKIPQYNIGLDCNVPHMENTEKLETKLLNDKPTHNVLLRREPILEQKNNQENVSLKSRSIINFNLPNYYLEENSNSSNHCQEVGTCGVKLKFNSQNATSNWQPEELLPKETEFQKMLRSLRATDKKPGDIVFGERIEQLNYSSAAQNGLEVRIASSSVKTDNRRASWSVSDKFQHFHPEDTKGFSTKINFGPNHSTLIDSSAQASHFPDIRPNSYNSSNAQRSPIIIQEDKHSSDSTHRASRFEPLNSSRQGNREAGSLTVKTTGSLLAQKNQQELEQLQQTKLTDTSHRTPERAKAESVHKPRIQDTNELYSVNSNRDELKMLHKPEQSLLNDGFIRLSNSWEKKNAWLEPSAKKASTIPTDAHLTPRHGSLFSQPRLTESKVSDGSTLLNKTKNDYTYFQSKQMSRKGSSEKETVSNAQIKSSIEATHSSVNKNNEIVSLPKPCSTHKHKKFNKIDSKTSMTKYDEKTDILKKNGRNKSEARPKSSDKKPVTTGSGRDGWLNVSKEIQPRKKPELSAKRLTMKKDANIEVSSSYGPRICRERKESITDKNQETCDDLSDSRERESNISDELMKAADQIMLAVNGYTDDDSIVTSSSNEGKTRKDSRSLQTLKTIYEPTDKKQSNGNKNKTKQHNIRSTRSTDLRMEYQASVSKKKEGRTVSSREAVSNLPSKDSRADSVSSSKERRMQRATRLMQRACSREHLLQGTASSSEDLGSGSDTGLRSKRVYRKPRLKHRCSRQEKTTDASTSGTKKRTD